jgi:hypothetical protein
MDYEGNTIVFPETMAYLAKKVKHAKVVIWWLSIDNYLINFNLRYYRDNGLKPTLLELKKIFRRPAYNQMVPYLHISQSIYAQEFLKSKDISSTIVSDYLNTEFIGVNSGEFQKENIICYNPKKGLEVTKRIMNYYHKKNDSYFSFIPIIGMNAEGVKKLMQRSKIYIDFGGHPGKDRMPREARLQECVIITGKKGSAGNDTDIFIPSAYKLNENELNFLIELDYLIKDVVDNFDAHLKNQYDYRLRILNEKREFALQVSDFVKNLNKIND